MASTYKNYLATFTTFTKLTEQQLCHSQKKPGSRLKIPNMNIDPNKVYPLNALITMDILKPLAQTQDSYVKEIGRQCLRGNPIVSKKTTSGRRGFLIKGADAITFLEKYIK